MNITIAMSIGGAASFTKLDKGSCLPNVLYSIVNQSQFDQYNVKFAIFNHSEDDTNVRDIFSKFIDVEQIKIQSGSCESFTRLNTKFKRDTGIVDTDADIVFYQSCDTIWFDPDILKSTTDMINDKNIVVSTNTQDVHVPYALHSNSADYRAFNNTLTTLLNNTPAGSRGRKNAKFMYLGAMRKGLFDMYTDEPFMCDLTQHNFFQVNDIEFVISDNMSIHQKHKYNVMPCLDFNNCNNKYGNKASCGRKTNPRMQQETLAFIEQFNNKQK